MAEPDAEAALPALAEPTHFPVRTWLISFAGWMFDFYDLVLFSFLLIPIGNDLGLTEPQEAVLLGVALGASGLGGIAFGYLSDRFGRKRIMGATIILFSAGTALTGLASGPVTLVLFRLLTGLGVGGEWAVGHAIMAESTPARMRGRASALLQAGEPVGVALAAVMGLLVSPWLGWRAVCLVSAASALVAVLVRRHLPESALWERQRHQALSLGASFRLLARPGVAVPAVKGFVLGVFKLGTYWTCYTWLPKFLQREFHQPVGRSALWILTAQLGQLLGMMAFGHLADRFGRRLAFTGYSALTALALYPLAFHWEALLPRPALFWTVLFALGLGSGCTAGFGALLAELFPTEVRNFAMGATYNSARAVQFFAPILVSALVAAYGLSGGLSLPFGLALATGTWVWVLPETRRRSLAVIPTGSPGSGA